MPKRKDGFPRPILGLAALLAAMTTACARDRGPVRVDGFSRESTLGSDLRAVPRGVTIPPTALGVDLVDRRSSAGGGTNPGADLDPQLLPATLK